MLGYSVHPTKTLWKAAIHYCAFYSNDGTSSNFQRSRLDIALNFQRLLLTGGGRGKGGTEYHSTLTVKRKDVLLPSPFKNGGKVCTVQYFTGRKWKGRKGGESAPCDEKA
jgi:hypothetical protein